MTTDKSTTTAQILSDGDQYLMKTYARNPIALADGYDCTLVDTDGREYIDFLSGIATVNLGYSNDKVKEAMHHQVNTLVHTSNFFYTEAQSTLGKLLCENSFADRAFFSNSGVEANEGAVKLARKYAYLKYGPQKNEIIAMRGCFHGRTIATLSITDVAKYREGYGPEPAGFSFTPFNDIEALEKVVGENTAGIILEPVQGEGGVYPVDPAFLKKARELCDQYDCALIYDEIQCGMGRTGKLFAYEHYGVEPDIMTLAKALANGVPIGAILAKGDYANVFTPGAHGTTFGGNPLATGTARAVVEEMLEQNIPGLAANTGAYFKAKLKELQGNCDYVNDVRGLGLLIGLELNIPGAPIVKAMLDRGFIINCTHDYVLRFIPPLVITEGEIDQMLSNLTEVLKEQKPE
ncbi:MAG: aspartate aminotransferase family protein [Tissierellia bacterium]|nr:aspartate aminotransferase family protein [Tissierellia bacterium]